MINFRDHERMPHGLENEKVEKHPTQEWYISFIPQCFKTPSGCGKYLKYWMNK